MYISNTIYFQVPLLHLEIQCSINFTLKALTLFLPANVQPLCIGDEGTYDFQPNFTGNVKPVWQSSNFSGR